MALDFVDDHQASQVAEGKHGFGQSALADGIFQVKILRRSGFGNLSGERGFATLARAVKRDYRIHANRLANPVVQILSLDHPRIMVTAYTKCKDNFSASQPYVLV